MGAGSAMIGEDRPLSWTIRGMATRYICPGRVIMIGMYHAGDGGKNCGAVVGGAGGGSWNGAKGSDGAGVGGGWRVEAGG